MTARESIQSICEFEIRVYDEVTKAWTGDDYAALYIYIYTCIQTAQGKLQRESVAERSVTIRQEIKNRLDSPEQSILDAHIFSLTILVLGPAAWSAIRRLSFIVFFLFVSDLRSFPRFQPYSQVPDIVQRTFC